MNLTTPQIDRLAIFRFRYPDDTFLIGNTIAGLTARIADMTLIDQGYVNEQMDLLDLQTARLIDVKGPLFNGDAVTYGPAHPRNDGIDPTDWELVGHGTTWAVASPIVFDTTLGPFVVKSQDLATTYAEGVNYTEDADTPDPGFTTLTWITPAITLARVLYGAPIPVYSHSLNWDDDQPLLDIEGSWLDVYASRHNQFFGTLAQLAGLNTGLNVQNAQLELVQGREFAAIHTESIGRYIRWATDKPVLTRQIAVVVTRIDNNEVLVRDVNYTFAPVPNFAGYFSIVAIPDAIPAIVLVTAVDEP